jgi:hypothetical protein
MNARIILHFALFLAAVGMLAGCGGSGAPVTQSTPAGSTAGGLPTSRPASAAPAATLAAAPTAAAQPSPAAAGALPEGLTAEGYHFLGRADAPVTLEMYSDFL